MAHPLIVWYRTCQRDLPWRRTRDPYAIWVSEIMLQQTQVATVIPYWERWMSRFPTVSSLAEADEQAVLSLWQGLGYYRRCRFLLRGAQWVVENGMPARFDEWLKVPGVGRYTAAAIASIAFGEAVPLVDGNVERVYARICLDRSSGTELHRNAWTWAASQVSHESPGDWNQALMELGATICRPSRPNCGSCPLRSSCLAFKAGAVDEVPVAAVKPSPVTLRYAVRVPYVEGRFGVRQILEGEWWQGMWEFPRTQVSDSSLPVQADQFGTEGLALAGVPTLPVTKSQGVLIGHVRHSVTHHRITIDLYLDRGELTSPQLRWLTIEELEDLPMPTPQRRCLAIALRHLGTTCC